MDNNKEKGCSFCGSSKDECNHLIAGLDGSMICDSCPPDIMSLFNGEVSHSYSEEISESEASASKDFLRVHKPKDIFNELSKTIVGQDRAKRSIAISVYNHYKRICQANNSDVEIEKSNIMLLGRTGTGKTMFARGLAKILGVPFARVDATSLTEAGYVGDDIETILQKLLQSCDYDLEKAQKGIIYIDEIDKLRKLDKSLSLTRDVSGEGVQQGLLTIVEGSVVSVPVSDKRKNSSNSTNLQFDTSNVLFICGGSFAGIEELLVQKAEKESGIGFGANVVKQAPSTVSMSDVGNSDLIRYGIIPEFLGRFPVKVALDDMDLFMLKKVISEPQNSIIKQYQELFSMDGVSLVVTDGAIDTIATKALDSGTGARGVKEIFENRLSDAMFEVPSDNSIRTVVMDGAEVFYKYEGKSAA